MKFHYIHKVSIPDTSWSVADVHNFNECTVTCSKYDWQIVFFDTFVYTYFPRKIVHNYWIGNTHIDLLPNVTFCAAYTVYLQNIVTWQENMQPFPTLLSDKKIKCIFCSSTHQT